MLPHFAPSSQPQSAHILSALCRSRRRPRARSANRHPTCRLWDQGSRRGTSTQQYNLYQGTWHTPRQQSAGIAYIPTAGGTKWHRRRMRRTTRKSEIARFARSVSTTKGGCCSHIIATIQSVVTGQAAIALERTIGYLRYVLVARSSGTPAERLPRSCTTFPQRLR